MTESESLDLIATLRRRLERERRARFEAESIAETVTRELYVLNRIKSEFLATISHELRTPLTALVGFTETLKREEIANDPTIRGDVVERMARQLRRLQRLIEQLLATNLLQGPELEFTPRPIDFAELVDGIISETDFGDVAVEVDVPEELPTMMVDPNMMGTVLGNLIDNAVKFSPDGGKVTIGARMDPSGFSFWVEDTGIGMDPDEVSHAFDPFWQADSSTTRRFGGVGLGLHLVKLITQLLGGEVELTSSKGMGSRVTVSLRSTSGHSALTAGY